VVAVPDHAADDVMEGSLFDMRVADVRHRRDGRGTPPPVRAHRLDSSHLPLVDRIHRKEQHQNIECEIVPDHE
jgi:CxxC motif-containing protein (DUF1111 family)